MKRRSVRRYRGTPPDEWPDDRLRVTLPSQAREALERHQQAHVQLDALASRLGRLCRWGEASHVIADVEQQVRVAAAVERLAWQHVVDQAASDDAL